MMVWRPDSPQMVYGTTLTLPAQLAADQELPVDDILRSLRTAEPITTRG
jgi:hypothetical protein